MMEDPCKNHPQIYEISMQNRCAKADAKIMKNIILGTIWTPKLGAKTEKGRPVPAKGRRGPIETALRCDPGRNMSEKRHAKNYAGKKSRKRFSRDRLG